MFNYLNKVDLRKVLDSWILLKPLCYEVMAFTSLRGPIPAAILARHTPQLSGLVQVALWLRHCAIGCQYSKADCATSQPWSQHVSCAGARECEKPETESATSVRVPQHSSFLANCTLLHVSVHCCLSVQEARIVAIASAVANRCSQRSPASCFESWMV